jgi:hypothetical protein
MRDRFANGRDHVGNAGHKPTFDDSEAETFKRLYLNDVVTAEPTAPKPPPAGLDPAKWATLSRAERRALLRHHRKVTGK